MAHVREFDKFEAYNVNVEATSNGDTGVITLNIHADRLTVSVDTDWAIGIRLDRTDGDYLMLTKGVHTIPCYVHRSIHYKVFSDAAIKFSVAAYSLGRRSM